MTKRAPSRKLLHKDIKLLVVEGEQRVAIDGRDAPATGSHHR